MPLSEAFKHAFKERVTYLEKESCICVPCRFVEWQHEHDKQKRDELYVSKNHWRESLVYYLNTLINITSILIG